MFRGAVRADMARILDIYARAREFMAKNGNPTQWGDNYPSPELLEEDIDTNRLFVYMVYGQMQAVFAFVLGEDPTYKVIEDGQWLMIVGPSPVQRFAAVHCLALRVAAECGVKVSELRPASSASEEDPVIAAASTGATAAGGGVVGAPAAAGVTRRTRKARLRLARMDPWSVFKTALLFAVAGAIIFFIATWVVWGVINASGVFDSVNKAVNDLVASPGSTSAFRLEDYVNTHRILGLTALIGAIDAVLFTALATLFSFLYNLAASVMGGLEVTLAED